MWLSFQSIHHQFFPNGYNPNLALIYLVTFASQFSRSIWEGNVISTYLYIISNNSNFIVGAMSGLNGFVQLLASPGSGYMADKMSRIVILKFAGFVGFLCTIFTIGAVFVATVYAFSVCMILWGIFWALLQPTLDALLADTVNSGSRSMVYSNRLSAIQIASAFGPALSIVLFSSLGNKWTLQECQVVMMSGLVLFFIPLVLLFLFRTDSKDGDSRNSTLGIITERVNSIISYKKRSYDKISQIEMKEQDNPITSSDQTMKSGLLIEPLLEFPDDSVDSASIESEEHYEMIEFEIFENDNKDSEPQTITSDNDSIDSNLSSMYLPLMIAISDVITGIASGMTIKFFPIYFMEDLRMQPIAVSAVYMVTPLCLTVSAHATQRFSRQVGRIWATVIVKGLGVLLLLLLAYFAVNNYSASVVIPVYILRSALVNSPRPLTKSIIMDIVPKSQRARWNAAESINGAMWSGSAMLGGYLIDKYGIVQNFAITALLQFVSLAPLIMISSRVPTETS